MNKSLLTASSQATFFLPHPHSITGTLGSPFHQNFPCQSIPYSFTHAFASLLSNSNHTLCALGSLPSTNFALFQCELLISRLDLCAYKIQKPSVMMVDSGHDSNGRPLVFAGEQNGFSLKNVGLGQFKDHGLIFMVIMI